MRVPRINPTAKALATNVALQIGLSVVSTVAVKYGTDALMRGIETGTRKFKKKRPIGFVR